MTQPENTNFISELRKIIWPIEAREVKKFLPMAGIMFCILFNYSMLRSIKDGFVVTLIGAEAISFLKTYLVLPSAVLAIIIYSKLCNIMSQQKVFYTITIFFLIYFGLFAFVFYPNQAVLHPNPEIIENLSANYPNFKWFIRIGGKWTLASFYVMAELWGAMMLSLLFWQFANQITKTEEAKRFYSMFGMLGNVGLLLTAYVLNTYLGGSGAEEAVADESKFKPVITFALVSGLFIIFLYNWINRNVLTDPTLYDPSIKKVKKEKVKLSIGESFKVIFTSKYLGLIALLILAYGISINLVEGVWKAKANQLYPTPAEFTSFMGTFQGLQGITAILFMIIGSNILRRVSWKTAAMFTPLMILVTGLAFFSFIFFDSTIGMYVTGLFASTPLAIAVMIGTAQNVLSKATKYSLFDSTKEMAYIPLDDELKTKGKAAVDVVGGRLGKSGGGFITSTFFFLLPSYGFEEATPYFAGVFFVIVILWLFAVKGLSKQYEYQKTEHSY